MGSTFDAPHWLELLSIISLATGGVCALIITADSIRRPQHMWIMNIVWPVTALFAGPLALLGYFTAGRLSTQGRVMEAKALGRESPGKTKPFWQMVAVGATHCGAGCTLGDIVAESIIFWTGWKIAGMSIWPAWICDYAAAYLFGIAFQYFTIKPMRNLSIGKGLIQAVKADTLSLSAWQLGMYGWMAIAVFAIFGEEIPKSDPVFWFMMQIAMLLGFATSYPVNWWLLRAGIKEKM